MKTCRSNVLTKEFLEECFVADFEAGTLTWKHRPINHFQTEKAWKIWNTRYSGTLAGATSWRTKDYLFKRVTTCKMYFPVHHVMWVMYTGSMFTTGEFVIDHIDRNPLNNKINNLRLVSQQQNVWNMAAAKSKDSLSKFKGVCYDKERLKWMLQAVFDGRKISGRFDCEQSAAYVYRVLSENTHKEFSPDFLKEVKFPENFDWSGVTFKVKRALELCDNDIKLEHSQLFKGLSLEVAHPELVHGTKFEEAVCTK